MLSRIADKRPPPKRGKQRVVILQTRMKARTLGVDSQATL